MEKIEIKNNQAFSQFNGLTKREYVATQVLAGLCANSNFNEIVNKTHCEIAIRITDELLKQLSE